VSANGTLIKRLIADTNGRINFTSSGYSSPITFAIERASGCAAAAAEYQLFLPLVRR
jgi:hypothetical protein